MIQVIRFVEIGLLCVQEYADDRPDMSFVVFLLNNENTTLPKPKQPSFCRVDSSKEIKQKDDNQSLPSASTKDCR